MITQAMFLLSSIALFIVSIYAYGIVQNKIRKNFRPSYRLIPNCLLTRHPVLLLAGEESAFYNGHFFNFIPNALREHGYEVLDFHPIGKGKIRDKDIQSFIDLLREEDLTCHWLCLPEDLQLLEKLRRLYPESFQSLQALQTDQPKTFHFNLFFHNLTSRFKLHPFLVGAPNTDNELAMLKFYLQLINNIAELDYQQTDQDFTHQDQQQKGSHAELPTFSDRA